MRLTCPNCKHSIDLNPEALNPDGSYYGRCSNCGQRLIKQPERAEEQRLKPEIDNSSFTPSDEADKKQSKWVIDIPLKKGELVWLDGHWGIIKEDSLWAITAVQNKIIFALIAG